MSYRLSILLILILCLRVSAQTYQPLAADQPVLSVKPIPDELRKDYKINPFYTKYIDINGLVIIGSGEVSDYAFLECAFTMDHLLSGQKNILDAIVKQKARLGIIGVNQYTMDIPENQYPEMQARAAFHDRRSRGLGGLPLTSCGEENLLNLHGDPYRAENITIHETAHMLSNIMGTIDQTWYKRLKSVYREAMERGDYGTSYAASNEHEYFAEGVQCWFDCANPRNAGGASTREELKKKDPKLADLITEIYGNRDWRYRKTTDSVRPDAEKKHLAGIDRDKMPTFSFENSPRIKAAAASTQPATKPEKSGPGI